MGWHAVDTHGLRSSSVGCQGTTCSASAAGDTRSSWRSSTRDGWRSPPWPVGVIRRCVDDAVAYAGDARRSAVRSARIRRSRSVAPTCTWPCRRPSATYHAAWQHATTEAVQDGGGDRQAVRHRGRHQRDPGATQVFGGYGFIDDTAVARHYRDAKILEIGEGTARFSASSLPARWAYVCERLQRNDCKEMLAKKFWSCRMSA